MLPHREEKKNPETLPHSAGGKRADRDGGGVTSEILLSHYSEMTVTPPPNTSYPPPRPMSLGRALEEPHGIKVPGCHTFSLSVCRGGEGTTGPETVGARVAESGFRARGCSSE